MASIPNTPERFWARTRRMPNGCLEWQGARSPKGYGKTSWKGSVRLAHRVALDIVGRALASDECALHSCDNPACVEPTHLRAGTRAENNAEMYAKGRARTVNPSGEAHPCARLSTEQVRAIRTASSGGATHASLGRQYGVTAQMVHRIVNRLAWRHVS